VLFDSINSTSVLNRHCPPVLFLTGAARYSVTMQILENPFRGGGLEITELSDIPFPSTASGRVTALLDPCPMAGKTPLVRMDGLAAACGVGAVSIKDERARMGLGSFKALGAAYVVACDAIRGRAAGQTYVTASAGNHGLSVAAGASAFGARAVVYLSQAVPQTFADRLTALGAEVVRVGCTYEESMTAAEAAARDADAVLLSDSSWPGYTERPYALMEGYLALMEESFSQLETPPSHILLQAGVGGLAGAAAAAARAHWGDEPVIVVVEPEYAPALYASIKAGRPQKVQGPFSAMGRLDCKEPSLIALKGLARDADVFVTITEAEGQAGAERLTELDMPTTPSGAAGLSALIAADADRASLRLGPDAHVMAILSEGPEA